MYGLSWLFLLNSRERKCRGPRPARRSGVHLRHLLADRNLVHDVVDFLAVPLGLQQPDEVREIVVGHDRRLVLEPFDEKALGVLVVEAERPDDPGHAPLAGPVLDVGQQRMTHLAVVGGLETGEPRRPLLHHLVVAAVDDPHRATDQPAVLPGEDQGRVAVAEREVLLRVEVLPLVHVDGRHPHRMVPVQGRRQVDEPLEIAPAGYGRHLDGHARALSVWGGQRCCRGTARKVRRHIPGRQSPASRIRPRRT